MISGPDTPSCFLRKNLERRLIHVFEDHSQRFFLLRSSAILNCVALRCQSGIGFHVALRRLQRDRP